MTTRRATLGFSGAVAIVLTVASTAYACSITMGPPSGHDMQITPNTGVGGIEVEAEGFCRIDSAPCDTGSTAYSAIPFLPNTLNTLDQILYIAGPCASDPAEGELPGEEDGDLCPGPLDNMHDATPYCDRTTPLDNPVGDEPKSRAWRADVPSDPHDVLQFVARGRIPTMTNVVNMEPGYYVICASSSTSGATFITHTHFYNFFTYL